MRVLFLILPFFISVFCFGKNNGVPVDRSDRDDSPFVTDHLAGGEEEKSEGSSGGSTNKIPPPFDALSAPICRTQDFREDVRFNYNPNGTPLLTDPAGNPLTWSIQGFIFRDRKGTESSFSEKGGAGYVGALHSLDNNPNGLESITVRTGEGTKVFSEFEEERRFGAPAAGL